jgi:hypothetical protein
VFIRLEKTGERRFFEKACTGFDINSFIRPVDGRLSALKVKAKVGPGGWHVINAAKYAVA